MIITIDIGQTKIVVNPLWGHVVFIFPNVGAIQLTLTEAIKVMEDIKAGR